jgi:hypothetical protein
METQKLTRAERERQLQRMLIFASGQQDVERLFLGCSPPGTVPPNSSLMIQTILDHEFGAEPPH